MKKYLLVLAVVVLFLIVAYKFLNPVYVFINDTDVHIRGTVQQASSPSCGLDLPPGTEGRTQCNHPEVFYETNGGVWLTPKWEATRLPFRRIVQFSRAPEPFLKIASGEIDYVEYSGILDRAPLTMTVDDDAPILRMVDTELLYEWLDDVYDVQVINYVKDGGVSADEEMRAKADVRELASVLIDLRSECAVTVSKEDKLRLTAIAEAILKPYQTGEGSDVGYVYDAYYKLPSQGSEVYTVYAVPNNPGFTTMDEFRFAFDACAVGGPAYPTELNADWLIFSASCGTGFDDGSGRPNGCLEAKNSTVIELK